MRILAMFGIVCAFCAHPVASAAATGKSLVLPGHGEAVLSSTAAGGWTYDIARVDDGATPGLFLVKFTAKAKDGKEELPPAVRVDHVMEQRDVQYRWTPNGHWLPMPWVESVGDLLTTATGLTGVFAWTSQTDANRLTLAISDAVRPTLYTGFEKDYGGSRLHTAVTFFNRGGTPVKGEYSAVLRFDFRDIPYSDSVSKACDWISSFPGQEAPRPPAVAYEPLWNSWYGYHIGFTAKDIEREAAIAKDLGISTIMYDMGWDRHGSTNSSSFAACGDWTPDPQDFPDMKGHLAKIRAMGLRTMLWCGVSLMGKDAKNVPRFKGKYTTSAPWVAGSCYALDPRFPEVRRFIVDTLVKGVSDWGADGWKIDFIQEFHEHGEDLVPKEGLNGRDYRWCADAARALQEEYGAKVKAVKPDAMFEFMMCYAGATCQRVATQVRAGDCPADAVYNRNQTARLRLLCGDRCAVHADMLTWSPEESPEACALQIVSTLHAVPQYGMRLTELTPAQKRVVRHWIAFAKRHADALYHGAFRPHGPASGYPLIEMESAAERIVTVHQKGMSATAAAKKPTFVANGTDAEGLVVEIPAAAKVAIYDCYGTPVDAASSPRQQSAGIRRLPVPRGGYAEIRP